MGTLIPAILGAVVGIIPELMKFLKTREDHKHELAVMKLQIEATKVAWEQRLEEIKVQRDISEAEAAYKFAAPPRKSGIKIFDGIVFFLNGLVRPLVTYWLFIAYVGNKLNLTNITWNEFDQGLLAGVASFWFTNRAMRYAVGQLGSASSRWY